MISEEALIFKNKLLSLDYLVFSSHKSATRSTRLSLSFNKFTCGHCHSLSNIDIKEGNFQKYLEKYFMINKKKLKVITIFREPIERHISSFFQGYGTRPLRLKEVRSEFETIIHTYSIKQLQKKFILELNDKSLIGYRESMNEISRELNIKPKELVYNPNKQFGLYETDIIELYFFRFDTFTANFSLLLTEITGTEIMEKKGNISKTKWYKEIYSEFKASLVIPNHIISEVYNHKSDLISLFYPDSIELLLNQILTRYGSK